MYSLPEKILIIRLSSIGDIVLTTPFICQVRKKFPQAQIDFLIRKDFEELLINNPSTDNLISYDIKTGKKGLAKLRENLIKENYSYLFDLHNNFRSIYLRRGIKSQFENRIIKNKFTQSLLVFFKLDKYKNIISIPERYLNVGKPFGVEDNGEGVEIFWNDEINKSTQDILAENKIENNTDFYTIAPGAGLFTKKWPIEYFEKLVQNLQKNHKNKIVIVGSEEEQIEGNVLSKFNDVVDLTGQLTLLQTAAIIKQSRGLISNDSGLMHISTAVKTPVLAIFGSTVEKFGFFPYRSKSIVVENKEITCRPCSHIGRKSCPEKHFKCMKELSPEYVYKKFEQLLNG